MTAGQVTEMREWYRFLTPILEVMSDGRIWKKRELENAVLDRIHMPAEQRAEMLPSGQQRSLNRIGWASSGLYRAELIAKPAKAHYVITDAGRAALVEYPTGLDERTLKSLPAYQANTAMRSRAVLASLEAAPAEPINSADPIEQIESGITRIHADVAAELLKRLRDQTPHDFEQSVLDVLIAMGYGGAEKRAVRIGGSGDGGVDGVIDQDPLGLDRIHVQAKRYGAENIVQRPTLQSFVGALHGVGASRGVFITTSSFSKGAHEYANSIKNTRVVLIDGERLTSLMIKYGVGVQERKVIPIVEVDDDYFE
ncbi:restriction endonuclease [Nocardia alni]|uniref:restriction endonuclease n=1 Tax=Nocardia alni TaxID=2815723 RepID=UPI0020B40A67|nr:restriction endonuclease [Nocardia alni]